MMNERGSGGQARCCVVVSSESHLARRPRLFPRFPIYSTSSKDGRHPRLIESQPPLRPPSLWPPYISLARVNNKYMRLIIKKHISSAYVEARLVKQSPRGDR